VTVFWNNSDIPGMLADSPNVITATPGGGSPVTGRCLRLESDELKLDSPAAAGMVMRLVRVYMPEVIKRTPTQKITAGGPAVGLAEPGLRRSLLA
jgi:hypothetical protein